MNDHSPRAFSSPSASGAQPLPTSASQQASPETFPGSLRPPSSRLWGEREGGQNHSPAPSVQRGRRGGQPAFPPPLAPARPPAEASPRGSRIAPPCPRSPAAGMSAGEAKEYLARREIPQLFEVGIAGLGVYWGRGTEGGWKDGAAPLRAGPPPRGASAAGR